LSPASRIVIEQCGAWPTGAEESGDVAPYRHMVVWEEWGTSEIRFDAAAAGREQLGWLVEVSPLLTALWRVAEHQSQLRICLGALASVEVENRVSLIFDDGREARFDFLVAADGAQSAVRRGLNVPVQEYPVDQVALATVARVERPHQQTAWQRFLVDGPLALLPSPDPYTVSVVWSQAVCRAQRRQAMSGAAFCQELSYASEHRLGRVEQADPPLLFPLTQQLAETCVPHPRVLLIGDALRVVHPMAGLGVNIGLEDVSGMLAIARNTPDLSVDGLWRRFARQRHQRSLALIRLFAGLQSVYSSTDPAVGWLRNFGVATLGGLDAIKQQFMREAMGLGPLARGNL
jgi:ubiquinone biosynthesis UbiH/UbiF/VisC/COQ6 family hydroxylase